MDPSIVWLGWLVLFLFYELYAAVSKPSGDTLSERVWSWFSMKGRKPWWLARRIVFVAFWLLLGVGHFLLGAPAWWSVILPGIPFAAVIVWATFFEMREGGAASPAAKGDAVMNTYDWKKTLWKGLRPALIAGVTAVVATLAQSVDAAALVQLGVPSFLAILIVEAARNYLKQHKTA